MKGSLQISTSLVLPGVGHSARLFWQGDRVLLFSPIGPARERTTLLFRLVPPRVLPSLSAPLADPRGCCFALTRLVQRGWITLERFVSCREWLFPVKWKLQLGSSPTIFDRLVPPVGVSSFTRSASQRVCLWVVCLCVPWGPGFLSFVWFQPRCVPMLLPVSSVESMAHRRRWDSSSAGHRVRCRLRARRSKRPLDAVLRCSAQLHYHHLVTPHRTHSGLLGIRFEQGSVWVVAIWVKVMASFLHPAAVPFASVFCVVLRYFSTVGLLDCRFICLLAGFCKCSTGLTMGCSICSPILVTSTPQSVSLVWPSVRWFVLQPIQCVNEVLQFFCVFLLIWIRNHARNLSVHSWGPTISFSDRLAQMFLPEVCYAQYAKVLGSCPRSSSCFRTRKFPRTRRPSRKTCISWTTSLPKLRIGQRDFYFPVPRRSSACVTRGPGCLADPYFYEPQPHITTFNQEMFDFLKMGQSTFVQIPLYPQSTNDVNFLVSGNVEKNRRADILCASWFGKSTSRKIGSKARVDVL